MSNSGCEPADYPPEIAGNIGLVIRGPCDFGTKSALAGAAGAVGLVIYNNLEGGGVGSLSPPPHPKGDVSLLCYIALLCGTDATMVSDFSISQPWE